MVRRYSRSELKLAARTLRNGMTDAERRLWAWLRRKHLYGVQFYRQRPIASYIVDFYAPSARLVIEVDGSQHMGAPNRAYDENRTAVLASLGLSVLRFDNRQVLDETQTVLEEISRTVARAIPPSPPLKKGGSK
jgi:very-short-patch-repair endonuclease